MLLCVTSETTFKFKTSGISVYTLNKCMYRKDWVVRGEPQQVLENSKSLKGWI
jgi:hypothetical protein